MFGITVADAVLVGTLALAVLAAVRGGGAGAKAKQEHVREDNVTAFGGAVIQSQLMTRGVEALEKLAEASEGAASVKRDMESKRQTDTIAELIEKLKDRPRRRHDHEDE